MIEITGIFWGDSITGHLASNVLHRDFCQTLLGRATLYLSRIHGRQFLFVRSYQYDDGDTEFPERCSQKFILTRNGT
jgi:hypothetical protein